MPKGIVVGLTVCLVLVGLGVAITGLRLIVVKNPLGWVLTLVGFVVLVLAPTILGRLRRTSEGPKS